MKKELQKEYDQYLTELKALNKIKKSIIKRAEDAGYIIKRNKVEVDETIYGIFYDMSFYSHFDGHRSSAVYDIESGASKVNIEEFNLLKSFIENKRHSADLFALNIAFPEILDSCENPFNYFKTVNDNEIYWEYNGDGEQGELSDGSHFTIKKCFASEVSKVKGVYKTIYD